MPKIPTSYVAALDQDKAQTDQVITAMIEAVKADLADGVDSTVLWATMYRSMGRETSSRLAAALAATLLRLAQQ